jgi:membrane protein implicated in regulation of membrane protease activity
MGASNVWWLLTGAAVTMELITGTFYLLMFAVGLTAGALAAHLGFGLTGQIAVAAIVGGGAVIAWHWHRSKNPALPANFNRDVHLDIGELVHVGHWNADGTASVKFRGAQWSAIAAQPDEPQTVGNFRIKEMRGSRLVLEKL